MIHRHYFDRCAAGGILFDKKKNKKKHAEYTNLSIIWDIDLMNCNAKCCHIFITQLNTTQFWTQLWLIQFITNSTHKRHPYLALCVITREKEKNACIIPTIVWLLKNTIPCLHEPGLRYQLTKCILVLYSWSHYGLVTRYTWLSDILVDFGSVHSLSPVRQLLAQCQLDLYKQTSVIYFHLKSNFLLKSTWKCLLTMAPILWRTQCVNCR